MTTRCSMCAREERTEALLPIILDNDLSRPQGDCAHNLCLVRQPIENTGQDTLKVGLELLRQCVWQEHKELNVTLANVCL